MQESEQSQLSTGEFAHASELRFLNERHSFPTVVRFGGEKGLFGRFKMWIVNSLRNIVFGEYLKDEQEYQAQLVRFLNRLSKSLDRNFWQDIREENSASYFSLEKKFSEEIGRTALAIEKEVSDLRVAQAKTDEQVKILNSVSLGLEKLLLQLTGVGPSKADDNSIKKAVNIDNADYSYLLLENRYRGSEEEISERLRIYPHYFSNCSLPVLEIGSGRGELQRIFRSQGIPSYGVELDSGMYEYSKAQGFDIRLANCIEHLRSIAKQSIGGVIAIQVVEHLTYAQLKELLCLIGAKVAIGGRVIFETIDSSSLLALTQNYFCDPTHKFPLHPQTLQYIVEASGLRVIDVIKLSPYNDEASFQLIEESSYLPPHWLSAVKRINNNFEMLNKLFFGFQDYCLIAEVQK